MCVSICRFWLDTTSFVDSLNAMEAVQRLLTLYPICFSDLADDGSTLVVFGGRIIHGRTEQTISSEIFVLDLNTMTWTRGRDYSKPRTYSVCTIVNGNFLSWGGKWSANLLSFSPPKYSTTAKKARQPTYSLSLSLSLSQCC
jgi:hypothetical protein